MRDAHPDRPAIVDVDGWPSYLSLQQIGILAAHGQAVSPDFRTTVVCIDPDAEAVCMYVR